MKQMKINIYKNIEDRKKAEFIKFHLLRKTEENKILYNRIVAIESASILLYLDKHLDYNNLDVSFYDVFKKVARYE